VTSGSQGIGAASALALADEGADVASGQTVPDFSGNPESDFH
jgi:NAD(P)-dependent dehydrogenase (short-subunit alcohol dehydrogenase family)